MSANWREKGSSVTTALREEAHQLFFSAGMSPSRRAPQGAFRTSGAMQPHHESAGTHLPQATRALTVGFMPVYLPKDENGLCGDTHARDKAGNKLALKNITVGGKTPSGAQLRRMLKDGPVTVEVRTPSGRIVTTTLEGPTQGRKARGRFKHQTDPDSGKPLSAFEPANITSLTLDELALRAANLSSVVSEQGPTKTDHRIAFNACGGMLTLMRESRQTGERWMASWTDIIDESDQPGSSVQRKEVIPVIVEALKRRPDLASDFLLQRRGLQDFYLLQEMIRQHLGPAPVGGAALHPVALAAFLGLARDAEHRDPYRDDTLFLTIRDEIFGGAIPDWPGDTNSRIGRPRVAAKRAWREALNDLASNYGADQATSTMIRETLGHAPYKFQAELLYELTIGREGWRDRVSPDTLQMYRVIQLTAGSHLDHIAHPLSNTRLQEMREFPTHTLPLNTRRGDFRLIDAAAFEKVARHTFNEAQQAVHDIVLIHEEFARPGRLSAATVSHVTPLAMTWRGTNMLAPRDAARAACRAVELGLLKPDCTTQDIAWFAETQTARDLINLLQPAR